MNLQHWIDQHPFWFAAIFPIYFLCLWCVVAATISVIGGWFALTKVYRTRAAFNGEKWKMQSGRMRWLANYNNVLTIGIGKQGLYLASMFLFRFMHPPLLIPWSEIKVRNTFKPSQFINEELRVGSFACFADPQLRCQDPAELCAFLCLEEWLRMLENTGDCANRARTLAMKLCLFVPAPKVSAPRKLLKRFGVPDGI